MLLDTVLLDPLAVAGPGVAGSGVAGPNAAGTSVAGPSIVIAVGELCCGIQQWRLFKWIFKKQLLLLWLLCVTLAEDNLNCDGCDTSSGEQRACTLRRGAVVVCYGSLFW